MGPMLEPLEFLVRRAINVIELLGICRKGEDVFFRRHHEAGEAKRREDAYGADFGTIDAIEFLDLVTEHPNSRVDGAFVLGDAFL